MKLSPNKKLVSIDNIKIKNVNNIFNNENNKEEMFEKIILF